MLKHGHQASPCTALNGQPGGLVGSKSGWQTVGLVGRQAGRRKMEDKRAEWQIGRKMEGCKCRMAVRQAGRKMEGC